MTPLPREHAEELLDAPSHDLDELRHSLGQVADVNRWLLWEAASWFPTGKA